MNFFSFTFIVALFPKFSYFSFKLITVLFAEWMGLLSQINDTRHAVVNKLKDLVHGILQFFHINMFVL